MIFGEKRRFALAKSADGQITVKKSWISVGVSDLFATFAKG